MLDIKKTDLTVLLHQKEYLKIRDIFEENNLVDLAAVVAELEFAEIIILFKIIDLNQSAEIFSYFSAEIKNALIEKFNSTQIKEVLEHLPSDDVNEMMGELPANLVKKVLSNVSKSKRQEINLLLSYPEDSAGSITNTKFVELKENDTMEVAINKIKLKGKQAESISDCYVVDSQRRLVGVVSLKNILYAQADELVKDISEEEEIFVYTHDDQEKVIQKIKRYDLFMIPVVNNDLRLVGVITVDDIFELMEEETTEDIQKMAAITPTEESYLNSSVFKMTMSRAPWLLLLMISSVFTEFVLSIFETPLSVLPVLSIFIPMVMGTSGNAGNQAAVMVLRGIAVDEITTKDSFRVLNQELKVSLVMAFIIFVASLLRIMILPPSITIDVAFCISLSIGVSLFVANLIGGLLPIIAVVLKQDPAAMAAPLITNIVDIVSLIVYFGLAVLILGI